MKQLSKGRSTVLEPSKIAILLLLGGIVAGALYANIFKNIYIHKIDFLDIYFLSRINAMDVNHNVLLQFVLINNFKRFLLFWVFSITILGTLYMMAALSYTGFCVGFIISVSTMKFGLKGILLFLAYIFPQYILYIPVAVLALMHGYRLTKEFNQSGRGNKGRMSLVGEKLPVILILSVLLLIGCLMETYINSGIIKNVLIFF